jgi:MFS family permease
MNNGFGGRFVAAICVGASLNPINSSIVAIALVSIGDAFDVGSDATSWLISALYVTTVIAQPTMGRLADRYGPRRIYLGGLCLLAAGGLLGYWGTAFSSLIIARVLIGLGTSTAYPAAVAMIRRRSLRPGRAAPGGVLGSLAVASQVSLAMGPVLGGVLIGIGGWRQTFLINVPLALIGAVTALAWLPRDQPADRSLESSTRADFRTIAGNRALLVCYLRYGLTMTITYCFVFGWTQWVEQSAGAPVELAGALLTPMFLAAIPMAALTARWARLRVPLIGTAIGLVVACVSLLPLSAETSLWALAGVSVLFGVQNGMAAVSNQADMYVASPPDLAGTAAGLLRASQYVGAIVASFLISVAYGDSATDGGLHRLTLAMLVLAVLVLVLTVVRAGPATATSARREFGTVHL